MTVSHLGTSTANAFDVALTDTLPSGLTYVPGSVNPPGAFAGQPPDRERINRFASHLASAGVTVTVRRNRGVDIDAACGQLRAREARSAGPDDPAAGLDAKSARMAP